jgi:hypothetical protein
MIKQRRAKMLGGLNKHFYVFQSPGGEVIKEYSLIPTLQQYFN